MWKLKMNNRHVITSKEINVKYFPDKKENRTTTNPRIQIRLVPSFVKLHYKQWFHFPSPEYGITLNCTYILLCDLACMMWPLERQVDPRMLKIKFNFSHRHLTQIQYTL